MEQKLKENRENLRYVVDSLSSSNDVDVKYCLKALENLRVHERALEECRDEMRLLDAS